jgi:hypothetical protein
MADECGNKIEYYPGKLLKCGKTRWTFDNNNFKPYDEAPDKLVAVDTPISVNLLDEYVKHKDEFEPEFIQLGAVTEEEIQKVRNMVPGTLTHPPVVKDMSDEQFKTAVKCYDDLVSVMVYPELEHVLKALVKQLDYLKPSPVLSWEDGRLAINGVKTKLRACEAFEAVRSLSKFGTHQRASEAVAGLLVDKLKELF